MVRTIGPAVGSKAQLGYKEECKWGYPSVPVSKFLEITSEGIASEYTNLVSAGLRSDRATHKQRTGTEAAGGDVSCEVSPEGITPFLKHALGQRLTKRKDIAFVMHYKGADTNRWVELTSSTLTSKGTTSGDNLSITITNNMTVQALLSTIHNSTNWDCYAPWGDNTDGTTGGYYARALASKLSSTHSLGAYDFGIVGGANQYAKNTDGTVFYLEQFSGYGGTANRAWVGHDDDSNGYAGIFPVYFKYGIYEHTLNANPTIPEGYTLEIGRDVAAFNYYGAKVNTLAMTINPGEIVTSTINMMCKGASTNGDPEVNGTNVGWAAPFIGMRYAGTAASAHLAIANDGSSNMLSFEHGALASEITTYKFTLSRPFNTHNGYYFDTTLLQGLVEFLEYNTSYFSITRKAGWNPYGASYGTAGITTVAASTDIPTASDLTLTIAISTTICPLIRGNYIGTDAGQSTNIYVDITTAGATSGVAAFKGSKDNTNWSSATLITSGIWYPIKDVLDANTGFEVMWPELVTLTQNDTWSFTTFKAAVSGGASLYDARDPYTGFQGAVLLDKGAGAGMTSQGVMSLNFTLNNNLYGDKYELGDRQRAAVVAQKRSVEGTINTEFDDLDLYRMFVNGVAGDLQITLTSDEYVNGSTVKYSMILRFPNIKFSGTTPVVGGPDIITTDFPFTALYDDTAVMPELVITVVNHLSFI